ncbi:hypothetical protein [Nereida sp. MMG025]|uniref:hypothetical protein n=1 Tax=Nereida sp. MMG025 TaxID=2909981 RepID=UPI001F29A4DD|nr:hypothetical protein [Nereida sp. MMG025]MCF6443359.1 hypothetical protein [Nereida sp. MMG025]
MTDAHWLEAGSNRVGLETDVGHLTGLCLDGRAPLHAVPWRGEPDVQADDAIPLVDRRLSEDFFAMPFGGEGAGPPHGPCAQSPWDHRGRNNGVDWFDLRTPVLGARLCKGLALSEEAPILKQCHVIEGGSGAASLAHHPMVHMQDGGRIFTSAKRRVMTPQTALEAGKNWLPSGQTATAFGAFHGFDLTRYPDQVTEDFVVCVEEPGNDLGWTAVMREAERDIVLILKRPAQLPITMLWYSNGGRSARPWNGRHRGVLGVEDGCAAALVGDALRAAGVPTAYALGPTHVIDHAIVSLAWPQGWSGISDVTLENEALRIVGDDKRAVCLPFGSWISQSDLLAPP